MKNDRAVSDIENIVKEMVGDDNALQCKSPRTL